MKLQKDSHFFYLFLEVVFDLIKCCLIEIYSFSILIISIRFRFR